MEGHVQINGIEAYYRRTGQRHAPVLFLHGLTSNGACWMLLARDLQDRYDIIMPDARGHGRSAVPPSGYGVEDHAADVLALIDTLALDRPVIIGHSMGGLIAALVAAQAPERIRGLFLEDPAFLSHEAWVSPMLKAWRTKYTQLLACSEAELMAKGRAEHPRWPDVVFPIWAQAKQTTSLKVFEWFDLPPTDFHALVARIAVPTLLVTGTPALGALVSPSVAAGLAKLNPLVRITHVAEAGHTIHYDQPAQYAAIVEDFLAECLRESGRFECQSNP